jgi:predicted nucleic acid-binding protein
LTPTVLDASVAVRVAIDGARPVVGELHAPELLVSEVLHALRRKVRAGAVPEPRAARVVVWLAEASITWWPHAPLAPAVWALRDELSAYDATYLALAASLPGAELLTADAGLASVAARHLGDDRVRLLA